MMYFYVEIIQWDAYSTSLLFHASMRVICRQQIHHINNMVFNCTSIISLLICSIISLCFQKKSGSYLHTASKMRALPEISACNKSVQMCSLHIVSDTYNSEPYSSHSSFNHPVHSQNDLNQHLSEVFLFLLSVTSGSICMSSCAHSRWKVEGTDCTQNWKSLLLRMKPAQISATPLATVETTTARIKDVDIWPCGAGPWGVAGRTGSIIRLHLVFQFGNNFEGFIAWH